MKTKMIDQLERLNSDFFDTFLKYDDEIDNISKTLQTVSMLKDNLKRIYFVGNGGSAAIASHMAEDFTKAGNLKAFSFNDGALLTCLSNDFSYEKVFEKAIELYCEKDDILFAISSSGKSKNIINAINAAKIKGMKVITLSGFDKNNDIINMGDVNFFIDSNSYRVVETLHSYIIHTILDLYIWRKTNELF